MAKPSGLVILSTGHSLYSKLLGLVAFTEGDTDGPARLLRPGESAVSLTFADNYTPDEPENAWNASSPYYFLMNGFTGQRNYYTNSYPLVTGWGFSVAFMFKTASSGPVAYPWSFRNSADAANDNIWWQYSTSAQGNTPRIQCEDNGTADTYVYGSGGNLSASTHYTCVVNFSDTAILTIQTNNASNNDTIQIGDTTYTFKTTLVAGGSPNEIYIDPAGSPWNATRDNIIGCINNSGVAGTDYGSGTVAHASYYAQADGNNVRIIRRENIPGLGTSSSETLTASTSNWSWDASYLGYSGGAHDGNVWIEVYMASSASSDLGSEWGGGGQEATLTFPADINGFMLGGNSESGSLWGNGDFDFWAVFDRPLNSTDRETFHDMGPATNNNYGLVAAPATYVDMTATGTTTLGDDKVDLKKVFVGNEAPKVLIPSLAELFGASNLNAGRGFERGM